MRALILTALLALPTHAQNMGCMGLPDQDQVATPRGRADGKAFTSARKVRSWGPVIAGALIPRST